MLTPLRLSGNIFSSGRWLKMWNFWRCGTVNSFWSQIDFCSSQLYLSDQTSIQIHLKSVLPLCGRYCSNYWHFNYNLHWIYAIFCRIIYRVNRYYTEIERRNTGQKNRNQRKINRFSPYMSATDIDCFQMDEMNTTENMTPKKHYVATKRQLAHKTNEHFDCAKNLGRFRFNSSLSSGSSYCIINSIRMALLCEANTTECRSELEREGYRLEREREGGAGGERGDAYPMAMT